MDFRDNIRKRQELIRKMNQQKQMTEYRENQRKMNGLNTAKNIASMGHNTINMGENLKGYGKTLDTVGNKLAGSSNGFASNIGNFSKNLGKNFTDAGNKVDLLKGNITKNISNTKVGEAGKAIGNKLGETKGAIGKGLNTISGKAMNSAVGQGLQKAGGKLAQSALGQGLKAGASKVAGSVAGKALAGAASKALGALAGPVGVALMAGKFIYDKVQSAKKKRDQKAMAKAQAASEEAIANKKQQNANIMQEGMENQVELQNKMANIQDNMNQSDDTMGYAGTLPEIANYQNNTDMTEPIVEPQIPQQQIQQPIVNQGENNMQPQENNAGLVNKLMGLIGGAPTGGAAPVIQPQDPITGPALDPTAGVAQAQQPNMFENIMNKVKGFNLGEGLRDMNAGYQDNVKTSFTEGDLYNRLSGGQLPDASVQAGEQVTPDANGVIEGGTANNDPKVSNIMSRIGELAGTAQRTLSRPMVQGAIASGIAAANGNDIGTSLEYGFNWGKDKAVSDRYRQLIDPEGAPSLLGGYTNQDYNSYLSKLRNDREVDKEAYNRKRNAKNDAWKKEKEQKDLELKEKELEAKKNAGYFTKNYGRGNSQYGNSNPRNDKYALELLIKQRDDAKVEGDEGAVQFYQDQINQLGGYTPRQTSPANNTPASTNSGWINNVVNSIKQQGAEAQKNIDTSNYVMMEAPGQGRRLVPANQIQEMINKGARIVNG